MGAFTGTKHLTVRYLTHPGKNCDAVHLRLRHSESLSLTSGTGPRYLGGSPCELVRQSRRQLSSGAPPPPDNPKYSELSLPVGPVSLAVVLEALIRVLGLLGRDSNKKRVEVSPPSPTYCRRVELPTKRTSHRLPRL